MIVRRLPVGPVATNCYVVGCPETHLAAVIDPGADAGQVLAQLRQRELTLALVLLTHAHFDHIGAVADLLDAVEPRVPLGLHPGDLALLQADGGAALFGVRIRPCPPPDLELAAGQVLEVGTLRFHVLHTPGHTPGHVTFHEPGAQAAFDGDVLFQDGIGRTDFPGSSTDELMRSIREQLLTLPDETTLFPGHGPRTTVGRERASNPFLTGAW
jgi:glyoxylase-like metal-dependent hydrolase (beta-lactamase superfamily II)